MAGESKQVHPNALPGFLKAVVTPEKLRDHYLNPMSARGKHKALVIKSALGFDQSNWELLKEAILDTLPYHEAVCRKQTEYGSEYTVMLPITGPNGQTQEVLTGWIIEVATDYPRLTIARVVTEKEAGYVKYQKGS